MASALYTQTDNGQTTEPVDFSPLLGSYTNLNPETANLLELTLAAEGPHYTLHALGSGEEPVDLGITEAAVFAASGSNKALGFQASIQASSGRLHLFANINQKLCVVQTYREFTDGSGRMNHFSKEYFMARGHN